MQSIKEREYERIQSCLPFEHTKTFKENVYKEFPRFRNMVDVAGILDVMDNHRPAPSDNMNDLEHEGYVLSIRMACAAYLSRYVPSLTFSGAFELIDGHRDWSL